METSASHSTRVRNAVRRARVGDTEPDQHLPIAGVLIDLANRAIRADGGSEKSDVNSERETGRRPERWEVPDHGEDGEGDEGEEERERCGLDGVYLQEGCGA